MTPSREKSRAYFEQAQKLIPGGVNSPARAFGAVGGSPLFIDRGRGAYLYDANGNELIDFVGSWGPHILGHRHPDVIAAIEQVLKKGTSFGAPTVIETELAQLVVDAVASVEKVRMVNSGTEATMSAIRVARGFTGRDKIVKFAGCYHGHVDSLLVQAGSGALTLGVPSSPGIPAGCTADTLVLEFNDANQLEETFSQHGDQLAAIILEPVVGNMGCVPPEPGFLEACRELCTKHGVVLIFDEVMTGFRVAYGGAQERYGVTPDLTTLGKIIGGGMPVGAYGGRADIMDTVSPVGPVYQAGTLSGNPLAMACGIATLQKLRDSNPYPALEAMTARLCDGLRRGAKAARLDHSVNQVGSMFTLFFNPERVVGFVQSSQNNTERFAAYFQGMLDRGIYLPCSQFEANFVSTAHSAADIDRTIAAANEVLATIA
jgi:glutamate-1-semialdehyde 2,1-aminomutase